MFTNYTYLLPNLVTIFYNFFLFYFLITFFLFFNNSVYFFFKNISHKNFNKQYNAMFFYLNVFYLSNVDSLNVTLFSEFGNYVQSFLNLLHTVFIEGILQEFSIYLFALFNNYFSFVFNFQHYFLFFVIFSPLFNSILLGLFGSFFSKTTVVFFTFFFMGLVLVSSLSLFFNTWSEYQIFNFNNLPLNGLDNNYTKEWLSTPNILDLGTWIPFSNFNILNWVFICDGLSVSMLFIVSIVSFLVHQYSFSYMKEDPYLFRFISYLSLFTFFMFFLVTSNNLFQLFLGWEGVGLCSYLLIGFWYHRIEANKAALKAVFMNKIGDVFLFVGIILCFYLFKSVTFSVIFAQLPFVLNHTFFLFSFEVHALSLIAFCFLVAAIGKSAQLGLHTWLPDAMEGPTPVSALIHAATMVTAGIFLIIRCSLIFINCPYINSIMIVVGILTILFAGCVAMVQYDIKKVIAYSTCSQLGFMLVSCGTNSYVDALIHLMGHAFFKAALFLGAGYLIYSLHDEQDMRKMGALAKVGCWYTFLVFLSMTVASLGLMGFIGFTGFYTKDPIVLSFLGSSLLFKSFPGFLHDFFNLELFLFFGLFLTSYYSMRVNCLVFFGGNTSNVPSNIFRSLTTTKATQDHVNLAFCVTLLTVLSIFFGCFLKDFLTKGFLFPIYTNASLFYFPSHILGEYSLLIIANLFFNAFLIYDFNVLFFHVLEYFFHSELGSFYTIPFSWYIYFDKPYLFNGLSVLVAPIFYSSLGLVLGYLLNNTKTGFKLYNKLGNPVYFSFIHYDLTFKNYSQRIIDGCKSYHKFIIKYFFTVVRFMALGNFRLPLPVFLVPYLGDSKERPYYEELAISHGIFLRTSQFFFINLGFFFLFFIFFALVGPNYLFTSFLFKATIFLFTFVNANLLWLFLHTNGVNRSLYFNKKGFTNLGYSLTTLNNVKIWFLITKIEGLFGLSFGSTTLLGLTKDDFNKLEKNINFVLNQIFRVYLIVLHHFFNFFFMFYNISYVTHLSYSLYKVFLYFRYLFFLVINFCHNFFAHKFYFDKFYNIITNFFLNVGLLVTFKQLDKGLFEYFGPTGFVRLLSSLSLTMVRFHNASLSRYLKIVFYSLLFLLFIFLFIL